VRLAPSERNRIYRNSIRFKNLFLITWLLAKKKGFSQQFQRQLAKLVKTPWLMATGEDFRWSITHAWQKTGIVFLESSELSRPSHLIDNP